MNDQQTILAHEKRIAELEQRSLQMLEQLGQCLTASVGHHICIQAIGMQLFGQVEWATPKAEELN